MLRRIAPLAAFGFLQEMSRLGSGWIVRRAIARRDVAWQVEFDSGYQCLGFAERPEVFQDSQRCRFNRFLWHERFLLMLRKSTVIYICQRVRPHRN